MNIFYPIILITGMVMLARSALFWLYFIQTKHYRLDRIWLGIKQRAFWRLVLSKHRVIIAALTLFVLLVAILPLSELSERVAFKLFDTWVYLVAVYFFAYSVQTAIQFTRRAIRVPRWTLKIGVLIVVILGTEIMLTIFHLWFDALDLLFIEIFQPVVVLGIFTIIYIPNIFFHRYLISRAKKKISAHKNLTVIGITGSYGKTTTKEFLAHILSKKFNVLKTPAHINVDTGVAKVILREFSPPLKGGARGGSAVDAPTPPNPPSLRAGGPPGPEAGRGGYPEVFIVEMGAYRRGEIRKICDLVQPQYAVMTGLSDQHLELFGSMEAIADAKFELIESVKDPAHTIANADSEPLVAEFKRRHLMPRWYGIKAPASRFKLTEIMCNEKGTSFTLHGVKFQVPTIGTAALNNLLGAITLAVELGLHLKDIAQMVRDLAPVPHTMELKSTPSCALIIDDTYNVNTEGVIVALSDLKYFNRPKRICVFSEVIELGERADEDHAQIAHTIAKTTDYVLLLPSHERQLMCDTLVETGYDSSRILSIKDIEQFKQIIDQDTVVLCEGREAEKILSLISPP